MEVYFLNTGYAIVVLVEVSVLFSKVSLPVVSLHHGHYTQNLLFPENPLQVRFEYMLSSGCWQPSDVTVVATFCFIVFSGWE